MNHKVSLASSASDTIIGLSLMAGIAATALFAGVVFGIWYGLGVVAIGIIGFCYCMCRAAGRGDARFAELTNEEFARRYPLEGTPVDIEEMERMYKVVAQ